MQKYVKRGFEDKICNVLNEHGIVCLIGLPGVGKTTTARYIAVKMQRERRKESKEVPIVVLTHERTIEKRVEPRIIEFYDENGEKHKIQAVSFGAFWQESGEVKYLAKQVARIANRSFFDKVKAEMDAESLASTLDDVFGGAFFDVLKEQAENFLRNHGDKIIDASQLVFSFGISFLAGLPGSIVYGVLKEILKEDVKLKGELIFIVDDISDLTSKELINAVEFVSWLKEYGAKVILVKRIDDFEKYLEIYEDYHSEKQFGFDKVFNGAKNLIKWKEQFYLMEEAERKEFEEILKVNSYRKEKIKEVLKTDQENVVDLLYSTCAGSISIALMMLDAGISAEEMSKLPEGRYFSTEEIKKEKSWEEKKRMIRSNLAIISAGIKTIYEKIREKNFALLTLLAQDIAEDELEQFCNESTIENLCRAKGYRLFWNLEDFKWILESYEESFAEEKRTVYTLNERWIKMRSFIEASKNEVIEEEIKTIREVLLKIMTVECKKYGGYTGRMLFYALENIDWLREWKIFKLKEALIWGEKALAEMPFIGFQFKEVVKDLWKKERHDDEILLYAVAYASQLAGRGRGMFSNLEEYLEFVKLAEEFMEEETNDDAVLCLRAITYSSLAHGLTYNTLRGELIENYFSKAEKIIKSMSRCELKELAEFYFYLNKAKIKRMMGENPFESLKKSEEFLKKLEKTGITEAMKRFLEPLGGKVEEKFRRQLNIMYGLLYFELGISYMNTDEMKEARKCFKNAIDHAETVQDKLVYEGRLGSIEVIERYKFEWKAKEKKISFKDLWNECKSNLWRFTSESIASICVKYLVSEIAKGEFKREDLEYAKMNLYAFSLLNGIGCIFGFIDKNDALKELKELELRLFDDSR